MSSRCAIQAADHLAISVHGHRSCSPFVDCPRTSCVTGTINRSLSTTRIRPFHLTLSTLLVLGFASVGFSQTQPTATTTEIPTYELSAGYQFLHLPDQNFPFGLAIDGARHYGPLGLVAEVGWSRRSDDVFG